MQTTDTRVPPLLPTAAGCTPAPVGWRLVALLMDLMLAGLAASFILVRLVLPQQIPNADEIFHRQWAAAYATAQVATDGGPWRVTEVTDDFKQLREVSQQTVFIVVLAYFTLCEWMMAGSTLGKRAFHLRAAQWGSAAPPNPLESLARCVVKSSFILWTPLLAPNAVLMLIGPTRRAGHDYIARTIVTRAPLPPPEPEKRDEDWEW